LKCFNLLWWWWWWWWWSFLAAIFHGYHKFPIEISRLFFNLIYASGALVKKICSPINAKRFGLVWILFCLLRHIIS
jgi:hypothetical protein